MSVIKQIHSQNLITPNPLKTLEAREEQGVEAGEYYGFTQLINEQLINLNHYTNIFTPDYPDPHFIEDILGGDNFKLSILDTNLNIIVELGSGELNTNDRYFTFAYYLKCEQNQIKIFGIGTNKEISEDHFVFSELTFNMDLELINEIWFDLPITDIKRINHVAKNNNGNYVMTARREVVPGNSNTLERFLCEFNLEGEVLNYKAPLVDISNLGLKEENVVKQLSNGYYVLFPYYILDQNFNEVALFDEHEMILSGKIEELDSTRFLIGGTGFSLINNNTELITYEALCIGDIEGNLDTIFYNSWPHFYVDTHPGARALSAKDTSHIYFAINKDGFYLTETTYIQIHSLNINGDINWAYYFGGDASYAPIDIITMPDGGCMLTVMKAYGNLGFGTIPFSDLEYVIFDIDGNVKEVITSTGKEPDFELLKALVFPNPAGNQIFIEYAKLSDDLSIEIMTIDGKSVFTQQLGQERMINVNELVSGMYVYRLTDKGAFIQSGQIMVD